MSQVAKFLITILPSKTPRGNHMAAYMGIQENNTLHHQIEPTSIQPALPSCRPLRRGLTATSIRLISLYYLSRGGTGINPSDPIRAEEIIQHYPCRLHTAQYGGIPCFTSINAITTLIHAIPHPCLNNHAPRHSKRLATKSRRRHGRNERIEPPGLSAPEKASFSWPAPLTHPSSSTSATSFRTGYIVDGQDACLEEDPNASMSLHARGEQKRE
jgi:hypothetical protein